MRKVLLATTALVAMTGVQAANAADISIYGGMDWSYYSYDDGSSIFDTDGNVKLKATSTADNGITYQVYQSVGMHTSTEEDSSITISGDFGKIQLGGADSVIDGLDGDVSHYANDWTNKTQSAPSGSGAHTTGICNSALFQCGGEAGLWGAIGDKNHSGDGDNKVGYVSPTINGFTVAVSSHDTDDDGMYYAVKYKNDMFAVMVGQGEEGDRKDSSMGVGVTMAGVTLRYQSGNSKVGSTNQVDRAEIGATTTISGVDFWVGKSSEEEKIGTADKIDITSVGAGYSVAPGVTLSSEYFQAESLTNNENSTSINLSVAF
jgi:hypothetical protein